MNKNELHGIRDIKKASTCISKLLKVLEDNVFEDLDEVHALALEAMTDEVYEQIKTGKKEEDIVEEEELSFDITHNDDKKKEEIERLCKGARIWMRENARE